MSEKTTILTHGGCWDGATAAAILLDIYPAAKVIEGRYGEHYPQLDDGGHKLVMADFSLPAERICDLAQVWTVIEIYDHHASAERGLVDLPASVRVVFDLDESGASLVWREYHTETSMFVDYVRDWDLWRFALPDSRELRAAVFSRRPTWERARLFVNGAAPFHAHTDALVMEGKAILRRDDVIIESLIRTARHIDLRWDGGTITVPACQSPYGLGSDVAGRMAERHESGVGVYWIDWPDRRQYGIRARGWSDVDVSVIAEAYGGGGHRSAAGFVVDEEGHELLAPFGDTAVWIDSDAA